MSEAQQIVSSMGEPAPAAEAVETPAAETPAADEGTAESASEKKGPSKEELDFTRRFNALSRREREILQREQTFKDKYGEYESYQKERELVKSDPLAFLEKNGWKFNDLAEYVLNDKKPTADKQVSDLQARIDQLEAERKAEIEERERREKESQQQQTIQQFKDKIKSEVTEKKDDYEFINHFGEYDMVYDVINQYYMANQEILPVDKAAEEVEKYLTAQFERAAETNKFKKKFNLFEEKPDESTSPAVEKTQSKAPRTLTNDAVANSMPTASEEKTPYLSEEESKQRAAELIRQHYMKKQGYTKN